MLKSILLCISVVIPLLSVHGHVMANELASNLSTASSEPMHQVIKAAKGRNRIDQEYVVIFKRRTDDDEIDRIRRRIDRKNGDEYEKLRKFTRLKGFAGRIPAGQLRRLQNNADVKRIEENHVVAINGFGVETDASNRMQSFQATKQSSQLSRNVAGVSAESWGLDRIDQQDLPLDGLYHHNYDGSGVHAYIIDTGIHLTHNDFEDRAQWDFTASDITDGDADNNGHGTHLAGLVGGVRFGIAKGANLHAVKVLDGSGSGTIAGLIEGIEYVTANHQAPAVAVIGMSYGFSTVLNDAVARSVAAGVSYAVPTGDDGRDACNYSPASANLSDDSVITVGSTFDNDNASPYSNKGSCVDIYAPGLYIRSAWHTVDSATNTISHSPISAAYVAGVAAVIRGNDNNCTVAQVKQKVLDFARQDKLNNMPANSPNLLLGLPDNADACSDTDSQPDGYDHLVYVELNTSVNIEFVAELSVVAGVTNGSLTWNSQTGVYVYTPNAGFTGIDGFSYQVAGNTFYVRIEVGLTASTGPVQVGETTNEQLDVQQTILANGDTLVVWREFDGWQHRIYYQRISVTGVTIVARSAVHFSVSDQFAPTVTGTIDGGYIIGWQQDGDLYAQRYDANATITSAFFSVSVAVGVQANLSLAMLPNGSVVAVWDDVNTQKVYATIYAIDGTVLTANITLFADLVVSAGDIAQAVSLKVHSSGHFMVAALVNQQVVIAHYDANGVIIGSSIVVSVQNTLMTNPGYINGLAAQISITEIIAGVNAGGYIVAWTSTAGQDGDGWSVIARAFSAVHVALSVEIVLSDSVVGNQFGVRVAGLADGGFVAFYLSGGKLYGHRFDANWQPIEAEFLLSIDWQYSYGNIAAIFQLNHRLLISYSRKPVAGASQVVVHPFISATVTADILLGNSGDNILAGHLADNWITAYGGNDIIFDAKVGYGGSGDDHFYGGLNLFGGAGRDTFHGGINLYGEAGPDDFYVIAGGSTINGGADFDVVFFDGLDTEFSIVDDGNGQFTITDNRPNSPLGVTVLVDVETIEFVNTRVLLAVKANLWDHLVQVQIDGTAQIDFVSGSISVQPEHGALVWDANLSVYIYTPSAGYQGVDGFSYVHNGVTFVVRIEVGVVAATTSFNPPTSDDNQLDPQAVTLTDGTSVLLWREFDGTNSILYFQRFDALGVAIGVKVRVDNSDAQYQPTIAATLAGGFVVGWQQDGDLYAREYDALGIAIGIKLTISAAVGIQANLSVSVLANGYWLFAWDDVAAGVVYASLYSSVGIQVSAHIEVFADTAGVESGIRVLPQANGGYIVAAIIDGHIVTQHFSHTGLTIGLPITVSTSVTTVITDPDYQFIQISLAELDNGDYVVSWTSTGDIDGYGISVLARIYTPLAQPRTDVYVLSEIHQGDQLGVKVHAFAGGRFIASWQSDGGVVARIFDFYGDPTTTEFELVVSVHGFIVQPYLFDLVAGRLGVAYVIKLNNSFRIVIAPAIVGTPNDDILVGDGNPNILIGLDGNNKIWGLDGDDTLIGADNGYGGEGDDRFYAGIVLDGGAGRDRFYGGVDIKGGPGNDEYYAGVGLTLNASFDGQDGYDVAFIEGPKDGYTINADPNGSYLVSSVTPGNSLDLELWQAVAVEFTDGRVLLQNPPSVPDVHVQVALGGNTILAIIPGGENAVITNPPQNGTLTFDIEIGEWVYTPNPGFEGEDSFTYIDAEGNEQTVAVSVGLDVNMNFTVDGSPFDQLDPAIAILENGDAVVAWAEFDGSSNAVYYQRFDGNGVAITARTPVYADVGSQTGPTVVPLSGGGFVLGWTQAEDDVVALRFGPDGQFIGDPQNLDRTIGAQVDITLANLANGDVIAVYTDLTNGKPMAAILDEVGLQVEANIELFAHLVNNDDGQHITIMPQEDGSFVVATVIADQILAQPYSITGDPIGAVEVVATLDAQINVADLELAPLEGGGFAIAWNTRVNVDDYEGAVWARVYGPDRLVVSDPVQISDLHLAVDIDIAPMADGNFMAIWQSGPDNDSQLVARVIGPDGVPTSLEFEIHKNIYGPQSGPDMVILPNERLGVAYSNTIGGVAGVSTLTVVGGHDTDDVLQGDYEANILIGLGGNNTIYAGADRDIILHATIGYGEDGGDVFYEGRTLYGGAGNDTFYGGVNVYGGTGADDIYIYGAGGVYHGGAGGNLEVDFDVAIYNGIASDYEVVENQDGTVTVTDLRDGSPTGVSTLIDIEAIEFADGRQQLEAFIPNNDIKVQVGINGTINIGFIQGDVVTQPEYGTLTWNAELNIHFYEPNSNYNGEDSFTYTDEFGVEHTVQLQVGEVDTTDGVDSEGNEQFDSQITVLANGDTLVVWRELIAGKYVVFFQRIDASGVTVVARTQLHVSSISQSIPQVVATNTGGFMIGWQQNSSLYVRLYSSVNVGGTVELMTDTVGARSELSMVTLANGTIVASWLNATDGQIYANVYGADGTLLLRHIRLFISAFGDVTTTAFASTLLMLKDGSFIAGGIVNNQVVMQHYNHIGIPLSAAVMVSEYNTNSTDETQQVSMTELANGEIVVAWSSTAGQDGAGTAVITRVYNRSLVAVSAEVVVSQTVVNDQKAIRVIALNDGGFIAVWQTATLDGNWRLCGRVFNASGVAVTVEFDIVVSAQTIDFEPSLLLMANGYVKVSYTQEIAGVASIRVKALLIGSSGDDTLLGGSDHDVIIGLGGNNHLTGGSGDDQIIDASEGFGGEGNDTFYGGVTLEGGIGDDTFYGGLNLFGQEGNDNFYANGQNATIDGGDDQDVLFVTGNFADYTITDNGDGTYTITDDRAGSPDGTLTVTLVEYIEFVDQRYALIVEAELGTPQTVQLAAGASVNIHFITGSITVQPEHGTLVWNASLNVWVYTPTSSYVGVDTFTYVDAQGVAHLVTIEVGLPSNGFSFVTEFNTNKAQIGAHITVLANGDALVVWAEKVGSYQRIKYQRFNQLGVAVTTAADVVAVNKQHHNPMVSALADGGYVIAFRETNDIKAQRFGADNLAVGNVIDVAVTSSTEDDVTIASLTNGYFVIGWDNPSLRKVQAKVFDSSGTLLVDTVNLFTQTSGYWYELIFQASSDGGFIAAAVGSKVVTARYNHLAELVGNEITVSDVNTATIDEKKQISIAELKNGRYVLAWSSSAAQDGDSYSVVARLVEADGSISANELLLAQYVTDKQQGVSVYPLDDGGFVAAWQSELVDGYDYGVVARLFAADGTPTSIEFDVNAIAEGSQELPYVTRLNDGRYAIVYADSSSGYEHTTVTLLTLGSQAADILQGDGSDNIIVGNGGDDVVYGHDGNDRIYGADTVYAGNGDDHIHGGNNVFAEDGNDNIYVLSASANIDGGSGFDVVYIDGLTADYTISDNGDGSYTVTGLDGSTYILTDVEVIEFSDSRELVAGLPAVNSWDHLVQVATNGSVDISFVMNSVDMTGASGTLVGSTYTPAAGFVGIDSFSYVDAGSVTRIVRVEVGLNSHGYSWLLDTYYGQQQAVTITVLANSDLLVAWIGSGNVYIQRFDNQGNALTSREEVYVSGYGQTQVTVNGLSDGGFMVYWLENSNTLYSKRYDANTTAITDRVKVNIDTGAFTHLKSVELVNGYIMTVWHDYREIRGRLSNAAGEWITNELTLYPDASGYEYGVEVAALADGGFMVASISNSNVLVQRYNHLAEVVGNRYQLSLNPNYTASTISQLISMTVLTNGNIVTAWTSYSNTPADGDDYAVLMRVHSPAGDLVSQQTVVNQYVTDKQQDARVQALATGGFIVVWQSELGDGDGWGLMARFYDADGQAVSDEFQVTVEFMFDQTKAQIAQLQDGRIVISYLSDPSEAVNNVRTQVMLINPSTVGADVLQGDSLDNVLVGNGGADVVYAHEGDDRIYNAETVYGGTGDDKVYGALNVYGEAGNDNIYLQSSTATVDGGADIDVVFINGATNDYTVIDNGGSYTVTGNDGSSYSLTDVEVLEFNDGRELLAGHPVTPSWDHVVQVATNASVDIPFAMSAVDMTAASGSLSGSTYTPATDFVGIDSFTYVAAGTTRTVRVEVGLNGHGYSWLLDTYYTQQQSVDVTVLANSDVLVSWISSGNVYIQRFDNQGNALTSRYEVHVSGYGQTKITVNALTDGGFMVYWLENNNYLYSKRFDASTTAMGDRVKVSIDNGSFTHLSSVELTNGYIMTTWQDYRNIRGRLANNDGEWLTNELTLFAEVAGYDYAIDVSALADGGFMVSALSGSNILVQRYNHLAQRIGDRYQLNVNVAYTSTLIDQLIDTTTLANGNLATVWTSYSNTSTDGDDYAVLMRVHSPTGNLSQEIVVNQYTTGKQQDARVQALATGGFIVVWQSELGDGDGWGIMGRYFDADGQAVSDEFQVTIEAVFDQTLAQIALLDDGRIVMSYLSDPTEAASDVRAQVMLINPSTIGADVVQGDDADNVLVGNGGGDVVHGHGGNDRIYNAETIYAGNGDDTIFGGLNIYGEAGNDNIYLQGSASNVDGGAGVDVVFIDGLTNDYTVTDNGDGSYTVTGLNGDTFVLTEIETIEFNDGRQLVAGHPVTASWDHIVQVATNGNVDISFTMNSVDMTAASGSLAGSTYTPATDFVGIDSFTYVDAGNVTRTVRVEVGLNGHGYSWLLDTYYAQQQAVDITVLADDDLLVTWISSGNVYIQRFDNQGNALTSRDEVHVSGYGQTKVTVNALSDGGFMVYWLENSNTLYSKRYDANTTAMGDRVKVSIDNGLFSHLASIELTNGYIMTVWQDYREIRGRLANNAGEFLTNELTLYPDASGYEYSIDIAALADGGFMVSAFTANNVQVQRYNHLAQTIGDRFQLSLNPNYTSSTVTQLISTSVLPNGNLVTAWTSYSNTTADGDDYAVLMRVHGPTGQLVSEETVVNQYFAGKQQDASVQALATGGFIVVWQSEQADGDGWGIMGRYFDANGQAVSDEFQVTVEFMFDQTVPQIALLNDGRIVVSYLSDPSEAASDVRTQVMLINPSTVGADELRGDNASNVLVGNGGDDVAYAYDGADRIYNIQTIYAGGGDDFIYGGLDIYGEAGNDNIYLQSLTANIDGGAGVDVVFINGSINDYTVLDNGGFYTVTGIDSSSYTLVDVEVLEFTDGRTLVAEETAVQAWDHIIQVDSNGSVDIPFAMSSVDTSTASGSVSGSTYFAATDFVGIDSFTYVDAGTTRTVRVEVGLNGHGFSWLFDTYYTVQQAADVTVLSNNDVLVSWISSGNLYIQRFDNQGNALTSRHEVHVSGYGQTRMTVNALSDGGFMVYWLENSNTLYSKRFDTNTTAVGDRIKVSIDPGNFTHLNSVELTNGYIMTVWHDYRAIRGRLANSAGEWLTNELNLYPDATGYEYGIDVAPLADGGFMISSITGNNVTAQRYNHLAQTIGDRHQLSLNPNYTSTLVTQLISMAVLPNGNLVTAWTSYSNTSADGDDYAVLARVYSKTGELISDETIVNQYVTDKQQDASVLALPTGGFIVTWQSELADGDGWGLMGRYFDANGQAISNEFQVTTESVSDQTKAQLALMNDGRVAVSYLSDDSGSTVAKAMILNPATQAADVIQGDDADNVLVTNGGVDTLYGYAGDDSFFGPFAAGSVVDGGLDSDKVTFSGATADYSVVNQGGSHLVTDNRVDSPDGQVTLYNIETLVFSDGELSL